MEANDSNTISSGEISTRFIPAVWEKGNNELLAFQRCPLTLLSIFLLTTYAVRRVRHSSALECSSFARTDRV